MTKHDAILAVVAVLVLVMLYQTVRMRWPENYYPPNDRLSLYVSKSGPRYMLFIAFPPYLVLIVAGVYANNPEAAITAAGITYTLFKVVLSIISSNRIGGIALTPGRAAVLVTNSILTLTATVIARQTYSAALPYRPNAAELATALVAAVLAATLITGFILLIGEPSMDGHEERMPLTKDQIQKINAVALDEDVDPALMVAIGCAEALQRPLWIRSLEEFPGIRRMTKTKGLYQVPSDRKLTDIESCKMAAAPLSGNYIPFDEDDAPISWHVQSMAEIHNPDRNFSRMVEKYYLIQSLLPIDCTEEKAPDGRPLIDLLLAGRFADNIVLRGTFWAAEFAHIAGSVTSLKSGKIHGVDVYGGQGGGSRRAWRVDMSAIESPKKVSIVVNELIEDCTTQTQLEIDLHSLYLVRDSLAQKRSECQ